MLQRQCPWEVVSVSYRVYKVWPFHAILPRDGIASVLYWECRDVLEGLLKYFCWSIATLLLINLYIMARRDSFLRCRLGHYNWSIIWPTLDLFPCLPVTYLAVFLCNFSMWSTWPCWYGSYTVPQYSSWGLTSDLLAFSLMFLDKIWMFRLRNSSVP
jgi:hypothetical protein